MNSNPQNTLELFAKSDLKKEKNFLFYLEKSSPDNIDKGQWTMQI